MMCIFSGKVTSLSKLVHIMMPMKIMYMHSSEVEVLLNTIRRENMLQLTTTHCVMRMILNMLGSIWR